MKILFKEGKFVNWELEQTVLANEQVEMAKVGDPIVGEKNFHNGFLISQVFEDLLWSEELNHLIKKSKCKKLDRKSLVVKLISN